VQRAISRFLRKLFKWPWGYYEYYLFSFTRALKNICPQPDAVVVFNDITPLRHIKKAVPGAKVAVYLQNELHVDRKILNRSLPFVNPFIAASGYIRDYMIKTYDITPDRLVVALNCVNLETFKPRQDYLKKRDTLHVLYIGRIDPNKGVDIAVDAVRVLQKEGLPVQLTVAGGVWFYARDGDLTDPFLQKLKGKMDAVEAKYLGHVGRPDVPALIRENDVVCILSRSNEPFGLVILEAMASGCAVVTSNRGGIPEAAGGAAMLVDPDDFDSVVDCLRLLATDHDVIKTQKIKSVERAAKVSWSVTVDVLEQALMK
ncbi:MAG: glycosyltransferase family 4 protein, partial [Candidatus Omnitrophota bacterium]